MSKAKPESFSPYFTTADAGQVRAVFAAAVQAEGYASISELIEAATLNEVRRLQRHNNGKPWDPLPPGIARTARRHDPFPEGMSVEVARRDGSGWEPAVVIERPGTDEWKSSTTTAPRPGAITASCVHPVNGRFQRARDQDATPRGRVRRNTAPKPPLRRSLVPQDPAHLR